MTRNHKEKKKSNSVSENMEFIAAIQVPSLEPGEISISNYLVPATSSMFHSLKESPCLGLCQLS